VLRIRIQLGELDPDQSELGTVNQKKKNFFVFLSFFEELNIVFGGIVLLLEIPWRRKTENFIFDKKVILKNSVNPGSGSGYFFAKAWIRIWKIGFTTQPWK
jgi:hypothetical protein